MRCEVKRLILNARARLGGYALPTDQAEENVRQQAIEDFQVLLACRTGRNLLLGGGYVLAGDRAGGSIRHT